jgi:hypothetical protein
MIEEISEIDIDHITGCDHPGKADAAAGRPAS